MNKQKIDISKITRIHMVGIGGIGMSGLANIFYDMGVNITGSDEKLNSQTIKLIDKKCIITRGHGKLPSDTELVVRSYSINDDNPEIREAFSGNIPVIYRSELLKMLADIKQKSVCITGAHGKTTTTAMTAYLLDRANFAPTVLIGGEQAYFNGNYKTGRGDLLVTELDESDGFFSDVISHIGVITNLDREHMERYETMSNLLEAFALFINNVKKTGTLYYFYDDLCLRKLVKTCLAKTVSYGTDEKSHIRASFIKESCDGTEANIFVAGIDAGCLRLNIPGKHNMINALPVLGIGLEFGLSLADMAGILSDFEGVKRRFELKNKGGHFALIEDYAHHPTEIKAVINTAQLLKGRKLKVIFQPHRYTRTFHLQREFADSFNGVDELILTDIYSASEKPVDDYGIESLFTDIMNNTTGKVMLLNKRDIVRHLKNSVEEGDVLLVLGAGDINNIIPDILKEVKK